MGERGRAHPKLGIVGDIRSLASAHLDEFGSVLPGVALSRLAGTHDSWGVRDARRVRIDTASVLMTNIATEQALPAGCSVSSDFEELRFLSQISERDIDGLRLVFNDEEGAPRTLTAPQVAMALLLSKGPTMSTLRFAFEHPGVPGSVIRESFLPPAPPGAPSAAIVLATTGSGKTAVVLAAATRVLLHDWEPIRDSFNSWRAAPVSGGAPQTGGDSRRLTRTLVVSPTLTLSDQWCKIIRNNAHAYSGPDGRWARVVPSEPKKTASLADIKEVLGRVDVDTPVILICDGGLYTLHCGEHAVVAGIFDEVSESHLRYRTAAHRPSIMRIFALSATPSRALRSMQLSSAQRLFTTLLLPEESKKFRYPAADAPGPYPFYDADFVARELGKDGAPTQRLENFLRYIERTVSLTACPTLQLAQSRLACENMPPAVEVYNVRFGVRNIAEDLRVDLASHERVPAFSCSAGTPGTVSVKGYLETHSIPPFSQLYVDALTSKRTSCAVCAVDLSSASLFDVLISTCCVSPFCREHAPTLSPCKRCAARVLSRGSIAETVRDLSQSWRSLNVLDALSSILSAFDRALMRFVIIVSEWENAPYYVERATERCFVESHPWRSNSYCISGRAGRNASGYRDWRARGAILTLVFRVNSDRHTAGLDLGMTDAIVALGDVPNPQQTFSRGLRMASPRRTADLVVVRVSSGMKG